MSDEIIKERLNHGYELMKNYGILNNNDEFTKEFVSATFLKVFSEGSTVCTYNVVHESDKQLDIWVHYKQLNISFDDLEDIGYALFTHNWFTILKYGVHVGNENKFIRRMKNNG